MLCYKNYIQTLLEALEISLHLIKREKSKYKPCDLMNASYPVELFKIGFHLMLCVCE